MGIRFSESFEENKIIHDSFKRTKIKINPLHNYINTENKGGC